MLSAPNPPPLHYSDTQPRPFYHPSPSPLHTPPVPLASAPPLPRVPFEQACKSANLPPPGPAHFEARRRLWLSRPPGSPAPASARTHPAPSPSRQRLEDMLAHDPYSEHVWHGGLAKVWKNLSAGGRLRRRLPMALVMKLVHVAWMRDPETWPKHAAVPDSDDDEEAERPPLDVLSNPQPTLVQSSVHPYASGMVAAAAE